MRNLILFAAPLALVACAEEAVEEPAVEDDMAEAEPAEAAMVTANGTAPGTFEVTDADGNVSTAVLRADGTHTGMDADGNVVEESTWAVTDGKTCFTNTADGAVECWTESAPGEDGSFTATSDEGAVVTVRPVEG